jgi:hypothetical protein
MKINSDDEEEDYALFGKIILLWGYVEASLTNILLRLTHPLNKLPDHEGVPVSFSAKIKLAKRGFRSIPKLASIEGEACRTLTELHPLHEKRTIIAHGYYQGFTGGKRHRHLFGFYEARRGQKKALKSYYFSRDDLTGLTSDINAYREKLENLSAKTFRLCP